MVVAAAAFGGYGRGIGECGRVGSVMGGGLWPRPFFSGTTESGCSTEGVVVMIWADFRAARSGDIGTAAAAVVMVAVLCALAAALVSDGGGTLEASAASALSSLAPLQLFWCRARLL